MDILAAEYADASLIQLYHIFYLYRLCAKLKQMLGLHKNH